MKRKLFGICMMLAACACINAKSSADYYSTPVQQEATIDPSKVVVLSDIHVMGPGLLRSTGTAWTNYIDGQRKLVDYSKDLFDVMIERIKTDICPGLVLITGDLTKDGEVPSHEYVVSKLDELRAAGINTLVIPGNHDRGSNSNAVVYDGENTSPATVATNESFATMYENYGYGAGSERESSSSLTYACEPIEGLVVIGIDSGTDGSLSTATLNWVVTKATAARASGKRVIAMMHHPLIPHFTGADTFSESVSVTDYVNVRNALADAGIRVIFTGHFHTSDNIKDYNANLSREIYDVNTGSLISYPCDYRTMTLSSDLSTLSIETGSIKEIQTGDGFANTAKTRLKEAIENYVKNNKPSYSAVAGTAADAFIYHAEGDEAGNNQAQSTLNSLIFAGNIAKAMGKLNQDQFTKLSNLAYSMLQDYSNYGDENRQDRTADRSLNIELPASIKLAADGYSTYCSENKLDITKSSGLTAYIVSTVTDATVVLKKKEVIPAETGFIVKGTGSTIYDLFKTDKTADDVSGNLLHGTLTATAAPAHTYVLSTKGGNTGFFPATQGIQIPAHKAYLTMEGSGARTITFDEPITDINDVRGRTEEESGTFYNLSGQRVTNPTNGMYIMDGKKVIIK